MKLDLKKMAGVISGRDTNGPEDPRIVALNKKLAEQNLMYDPLSKTVKMIGSKGNPMKQKEMQEKMVDTMYSLNMKPEQFADIPGFKMSYQQGERVVPETGGALKELLVKEGVMQMNPKTGDVSMTEKGLEMKRKGLLSKYRMEF